MKNILILHGSNDLYGASKVLLNVVDCLNANQYKVHVILPFKGNLDNKLIDIVHKLSYFKLGVFRKKYLNFFWKNISKGGIIILDDYAYMGRNRQFVYLNKLAKKLNFNILTVPSGQGIIIKN